MERDYILLQEWEDTVIVLREEVKSDMEKEQAGERWGKNFLVEIRSQVIEKDHWGTSNNPTMLECVMCVDHQRRSGQKGRSRLICEGLRRKEAGGSSRGEPRMYGVRVPAAGFQGSLAGLSQSTHCCF